MLDLVLLRTFVSVVDTGNFTRAGEHLHLTQSTVSQQVIRLEQNLGCRLLDRSQRQVLPTEEGERLLGYARRLLRLSDEASEALSPAHGDGVLRLGVPEDLAGEVLMPVLTRFTEERPRLRLEVESGLSHHLLRLYRSGELDLLLVKQWGADSDCHARWAEPLGWFGSATRPFGEGSPEEPVPLVVFPVGALYRQEMIHALESIGRRWRIGYSSASLASLVAAVGAGLGVSLLPLGCVGPEHRLLGAQAGFPPIAGLELALYARPELDSAGRTLRDRLRDLCDARWKGCRASAERCLRAMIRLPQRMDTEARHMSRPTLQVDLLVESFNYKAWSDRRTLDAIARIDAEAFPASLAFALQQLNHMAIVEELFRARLLGEPAPHQQTNSEVVPGYDVLRRRLEDSAAWFAGYVAELPLERRGEWLRFRFADGRDGGMTRQEILFHIVNHGTYHRGAIGHALDLAGAPRPADTYTLYIHSAQPERRE